MTMKRLFLNPQPIPLEKLRRHNGVCDAGFVFEVDEYEALRRSQAASDKSPVPQFLLPYRYALPPSLMPARCPGAVLESISSAASSRKGPSRWKPRAPGHRGYMARRGTFHVCRANGEDIRSFADAPVCPL